MEIFKDIKQYVGKYQISNYGRVKSLSRYQQNHSKQQLIPERFLKDADNGKGYRWVNLYIDNKPTPLYVHRLVASAFINDIPEGMTVNHLDGIKSNNHIDNLEIVTYSENNYHAVRSGLKKSQKGIKKPRKCPTL